MAISMLKIRRPLGRLIFNMGIAIPGKTVFLIETAPWFIKSSGDKWSSLIEVFIFEQFWNNLWVMIVEIIVQINAIDVSQWIPKNRDA